MGTCREKVVSSPWNSGEAIILACHWGPTVLVSISPPHPFLASHLLTKGQICVGGGTEAAEELFTEGFLHFLAKASSLIPLHFSI